MQSFQPIWLLNWDRLAVELSPSGYPSQARMAFKLSPYGYDFFARMAPLIITYDF